MPTNYDFLNRPYPYRKNGLNVVAGYENDILSSDLNRKWARVLGDTKRKSFLVSAAENKNFFIKNSDSKLQLKAPFSVLIDGAYIELEEDIVSAEMINPGQWAYLSFDLKEATVTLHVSAVKPNVEENELLLGAFNDEGVFVEEDRLRVPTFCSNKIITDENMLENPDYLSTLRAGDLILLV